MLIPRATYQPGDAFKDAELFGPEPSYDMGLAFIEGCREAGWTIEKSLELARKIRTEHQQSSLGDG